MAKAFSYRFYPTQAQESLLRRTIGCVRLVYNRALAARTAGWYKRQERIGYAQTSSMLTQWKQEELQFLNEVSRVFLQQGLRHLQTAFSNFFANRAKYFNFKKKRNEGSAEFSKSAFKWKDSKVFLAKCFDPLDIRGSRQILEGAEPSTMIVRLNPTGQWYISIRFDDPRTLTLEPSQQSVGLDAGISGLVTLSTGEKPANPKHFNCHHQRLKKGQKSLSRKEKGTRNRDKARLKVARIQQQISNSRKDHLHKLTTRLIRENQMIAVESLVVKNIVKNHKLARSISDARWGELVKQLEYKASWYGRTLVKIDQWFPSCKRCGNCGYIVDQLSWKLPHRDGNRLFLVGFPLPLNVREWDCPECESHHDRDVNAACNILAAGLAVSVCGATVRPEESKSRKAGAMKQKLKS